MSTAARLAGFLAVLVAVFAAAAGVGGAVGPVGTVSDAPAHSTSEDSTDGSTPDEGGHAPTEEVHP